MILHKGSLKRPSLKTGRQEQKLNFKPKSFSQKLQKLWELNTETFKCVSFSDLLHKHKL